jgi:hypothetical protein
MKKKNSNKDAAMDDDNDDDDVSTSSVNELDKTTTATTTTTTTTTSKIHQRTKRRRRKNVTIESSIIRPLPNEFITYLLDDGVRLPNCAMKVSSCLNDNYAATATTTTMDEEEEEEETNYDNDDEDDGDNGPLQQKEYSFPDLTSQIQTVLNNYTTKSGGGGCFPKLNWSSPRDATWINCGTLKCNKPGDIYLLLKCSDFIAFDLEKAWDGLRCCRSSETDDIENVDDDYDYNTDINNNDENDSQQILSSSTTTKVNNKEKSLLSSLSLRPINFEYELILRKWCNLHPSMEFRCFIYKHDVIAICQRHPSKYYTHLQVVDDNIFLSSNDLDDDDDDDDDDNDAGGIHQQQQQKQQQHPYVAIILEFYMTYVQYTFANGKVDNYVLDIYLDTHNRVWIIDFNIWGSRTDALLYNWEEIMVLANKVHNVTSSNSNNTSVTSRNSDVGLTTTALEVIPEWKVVTKDMKSMTYDPLSSYRGPTDVISLLGGDSGDSASGGVGGESFEEFMKQCVRPSEM